MSRWAEVFELLPGEDVNGDEMDLGVSVLASFGSAHLNDFAGARFNHDKAVLAECRALHGIGGGGASIGALESVPI